MTTEAEPLPVGIPPISPSERVGTPVDGVTVLGSLSPSRAGDFMSCPLLYRFRTIDRLPEAPSVDAVRGTVVHKVLEDLFDLPAAERTPERAGEMVAPAWHELLEATPDLGSLFPGEEGPDVAAWLASCRESLRRYFTLEDPRRLEPADRELYVETLTDAKLLLRGIIDRVDVAPDGAIRIVDYKSGRGPSEAFEGKALFQLKFYALVLWRVRGVVPRMLQLVYLGSGEILRYEPDEADLLATERKVLAVWEAIQRARESGDWRPSPGPLCAWCSHKALCPAYGGTPPELPERVSGRAAEAQPVVSTAGPGPGSSSG
ncbi:MAG TPA: PD-(D/E)XK nuclease family protein [Nocardioides sp.]|nr:PD-(D/E)XK nuclease family protein [Nocardioides sp.]